MNLEEVLEVNFTGLDQIHFLVKVLAIASGTNQFRIYGKPTLNVTETTIYNYQIETVEVTYS